MVNGVCVPWQQIVNYYHHLHKYSIHVVIGHTDNIGAITSDSDIQHSKISQSQLLDELAIVQ